MGNECLTISIETAAKMLGISKNSAYLAAKNGGIPVLKIGKRLLVPKAQLLRLIEGNGDKQGVGED